jgi:hypothetical protein
MQVLEGPLDDDEWNAKSSWQGNTKNWSGVVRIPQLVRNATQLVNTMFTLLGEIPAAHPQPPPFFWGFLKTTFTLAIGILSFLLRLLNVE